MTRKDLGLLVSEKLALKEKDGIYVVDKILSGIKKILKEKGRIEIRGFGSFMVVKRKSKKGRIIATGEMIDVPPFKTVVFKRGESLKRL